MLKFFRLVIFAVICFTPYTQLQAQKLILVSDSHQYEVEVFENEELRSKLKQSALKELKLQNEWKHFKANFKTLNSNKNWIRISLIDQQWSGVAVIDQQLYSIDTHVKNSQNQDRVILSLSALNGLSDSHQCGTTRQQNSLFKIMSDMESSNLNHSISYDTKSQKSVCSDPLNGVCSFAEIEFAFDQLYQQRFQPSQLESQTTALINQIEGFYENDFNIRFNAITVEFLQSVVFDDTTDATELLGDIRSKKANGQVSFIKNNRSLFHLITGRDFDGTTAGIAYVDVLCNGNGFSSATSMILPTSGNPSLATTALVVAHELGHNFGSSHDGDGNNCPSSGFIMAPSVGFGITEFSTCSKDVMNAAVNGLNNPQACFDYPVELAIAASQNNVSDLVVNSSEDLSYQITTEASSAASLNQVTVSGSIPASSGQFNSVVASGVACNITGSSQSYECLVNNPSNAFNVDLNITPLTLNFSLEQSVSTASDLVDIDLTNNELQSNFTVTEVTVPDAVTNLSAAESGDNVALNWQDNSNNESGFFVERRQNGGSFTQIADLSANTSSFTDTNVSDGNEYSYQIIAYNAQGNAIASNTASITLTAPPPPPPPSDDTGGDSGGGGGSINLGILWLLVMAAIWRRTYSVK